MKKYFLDSNGCFLNKIDTMRIDTLMRESGWSSAEGLKGADIIIFNTCAFSRKKEDECIAKIKQFQFEKNKNSKLIIAGCLPIINKPRMIAHFKGPFFNTHSLTNLCNYVGIKSNNLEKIPTAQGLLSDNRTYSGKIEKMFYIRIAYGCLNHCSFCAVKKVFPKLISKRKDAIIKEVKLGLKYGYRNFALTAEDISVYGLDIGSNLVELLREVIKIKNKFDIHLYRLNPERLLKMRNDFIQILKSKRIKFLAIPVNTGSERILKLMNRRYKINDLKIYIKKLNKIFPLLKISFDIMVGFPGETENDFRKTLNFLLRTAPDSIWISRFAERPGTTAKYKGKKILSETVRMRVKILHFFCLHKNIQCF